MKKKFNITNVLIVVLFLVGFSVMLYPSMSDYYFKWKAEQEIVQYNQVAEAKKKDYSELWNAAETYNRLLADEARFPASETLSRPEYVAEFLNPLETGMMGNIDIPAIEVNLPIYQGTEERVLQSGAGHWLGTSLPTGGESTHCVLTAHNGLVKAKMFTDLDQLVEGDTFSLSILDRELVYEVDQILITDPDDIEPLKIVEGEDYVTLYTCYPYGVNTHRLLVRGHRVEHEEILEEIAQPVSMGRDHDRLLMLGGVFGIVLLGIFAILRIRKRRVRKRRKRPLKRGEK